MSSVFDTTTQALGKTLDFLQQRNTVTSANIANAETPGYIAKKVDFEDDLAKALLQDRSKSMSATHEGHFPLSRSALDTVSADVYDNPDINHSNDGNTVDLEKEMATLAEDTIRYRAATQLINKKMGALKYVIGGGR